MAHRDGRGADPFLPPCVQGGQRKITYRTKAEAKRRMRAGSYNDQRPIRVYHCAECGYFHLTSQPRRCPPSDIA